MMTKIIRFSLSILNDLADLRSQWKNTEFWAVQIFCFTVIKASFEPEKRSCGLLCPLDHPTITIARLGRKWEKGGNGEFDQN